MWIHTFISVPVCQKPIERGLSFVTRTAPVCLPLKYSLLYPWLKRCYLLSALREIIIWSHTSSALCKPGMSLFLCRWNIQMERIFDMVAYDYFGGFSSYKWLAYNDFWTSYYMKLGSIYPFFQDGHTQMTQTAARKTTEIIKFALVRPAMYPRKRKKVDRYLTQTYS